MPRTLRLVAGAEAGCRPAREGTMTQDDPTRDDSRHESRSGERGAPGRGAGRESEDDRRARLEQALRANLRRRKAQSRARAEPAGSANSPDGRK